MYNLIINGESISVEDWGHAIKRAREFYRQADFARSASGDYQFRELGRGTVGVPILRSGGGGRSRVVGIVTRSK